MTATVTHLPVAAALASPASWEAQAARYLLDGASLVPAAERIERAYEAGLTGVAGEMLRLTDAADVADVSRDLIRAASRR